MKHAIVREVDIKKVAEFLANQEKKKLIKDREIEKPDDIQSLELLLGMKVIGLWVDGPNDAWIGSRLNIRCLKTNLEGVNGNVEITMTWEFKELKDLKALDFVPEGSNY